MTIWDVGGQTRIRALWRYYYSNCEAVIFVVDSNDRERIDEAAEELHVRVLYFVHVRVLHCVDSRVERCAGLFCYHIKHSFLCVHSLFQAVMQDDQLLNADLLVFANKQDLYVSNFYSVFHLRLVIASNRTIIDKILIWNRL